MYEAPSRAFFQHARLVLALACTALFAPAVDAQSLTLGQAVQRALASSPAIRTAESSFPSLDGELAEARAPFWNNPQVSGELATRDSKQPAGSTERTREWAVGFSQAFEIAGQQRLRRQTAVQNREAAEQNVNEVRAQTIFEVSERFVRVLSLQTRIPSEEQTLALIDRSAQAIARRVEAGEDSILDANLARVEAERARNSVAALREQLIQARADLAASIQWPAGDTLEAIGTLDEPPAAFSLDELVASAAARPLLRFLDSRERAARSRLALERSLAYPDVTLGLTHGREGPSDTRERVTAFTVSVPLPFFKRNQAGIGRARTELTQVEIERQSAVRQVEAQVRALWARRQNLMQRVSNLNAALLPRLAQNQELTRKAFDAGELGLVQLLLANRQLIEAQRDLIDARTELRLVTTALEAAAGLTPYTNAAPRAPATQR